MICLLSKHGLSSHECEVEFRYAENLHKAILCARLEPVPVAPSGRSTVTDGDIVGTLRTGLRPTTKFAVILLTESSHNRTPPLAC